jgi:hypothetical protein
MALPHLDDLMELLAQSDTFSAFEDLQATLKILTPDDNELNNRWQGFWEAALELGDPRELLERLAAKTEGVGRPRVPFADAFTFTLAKTWFHLTNRPPTASSTAAVKRQKGALFYDFVEAAAKDAGVSFELTTAIRHTVAQVKKAVKSTGNDA